MSDISFCSQVKCRLLYINTNTKTVGLSLQQNALLNKAASFGDWSVGDIIDDAAVTRVDQGLGLLMRLSDGIPGFTHVSLQAVMGFGKVRKNVCFVYKIMLTIQFGVCVCMEIRSLGCLMNMWRNWERNTKLEAPTGISFTISK